MNITHLANCFIRLVAIGLCLFSVGVGAQTTSGNATNGQTYYNALCDGCHGATVGTSNKAIKNAAGTGRIGDGKIFVYDLSTAVRIRTGEEGNDAL